MTIRLGIIGLGNIIHSHFKAIDEFDNIKIVGVCDKSMKKVNKYRSEFNCKGFIDYQKLIIRDIDVILVSLPHGLHCEVTVEALQKDCHVMVEKPMAVTVKQCNKMLETANKYNKQIIVTDLASFYPGAVKTGEKFAAGELGDFFTGSIINERFYFHEGRPAWFLDNEMSGGGMFSNVGLHRLAIARACLPGLEPVSVSGSVNHVPEYEVEACTSAIVKYKGGGSMLYEEVGYYPVPDWLNNGTHFIFEKGIVAWDNENWYLMPRTGNSDKQKVISEKLTENKNSYKEVYCNLLKAVKGEEYNPQAYEYAIDVAIAQAAYASSEQGREIKFNEPEWEIRLN